MISFVDAFKMELFRAGLETTDPIIADGKLHRIHVVGDRKSTKNGWYILYPDHPATGVFGCWKRGIYVKWHACNEKSLSVSDLRLFRERKRQAEAKIKSSFQDNLQLIKNNQYAWEYARRARDDHPYLLKKKVYSHGLRQHNGALLVPIMDADATVHGYQRIWPNGRKYFAKGSIISGHFYMLGDLLAPLILVCEGYATAASLHEITGFAVAVAFDCGNLRPVTEAIHKAWPSYQIVICADDDLHSPNNPGVTSANEAANAVNARVILPVFPGDREPYDSDFNDLYLKFGREAVLDCLLKENIYVSTHKN